MSTRVEDSEVAGRRCLHFPGRRLPARRHGGDEQGKKWSGNILLSVLMSSWHESVISKIIDLLLLLQAIVNLLLKD